MSRTRILMVNERMNNWNVLELGDAVFGQTWANHGKPFFLAQKHSVVGISWDINGCDQSPYEDIEYHPFMFEFASVTCINIISTY